MSIIPTTGTPAPCQQCGSADVEWHRDDQGRPVWGKCRSCGATVEIQEVLNLRDKIAEAFHQLGYKE